MLSVYDFIEEHKDKLKHSPSFRQLIEDRESYHRRFLLHMANDMILKKILANDYGHACDNTLAKLCRDWVRKKTDCQEGW